MKRALQVSSRVYRGLLRLYPARFRHKYGAAMADIFDQMCRDAVEREGLRGLARLWPFALHDLLRNGLAERWTGGDVMIRRWFDLTLSLGMLFVGLSVLPLIALLIKLDSPGPVFYRGTKLGKDGRPFKLLKLRTMIPVGDGSARQVTRVGGLLRQTYLDEWPSFINVLLGDMSLIGPCPQSPEQADDRAMLSARPGLLPSFLRLHSM